MPHHLNVLTATLPNNFILAAAVAEWGLFLRNSVYKGDASKQHILEALLPLTGNDQSGYIEELYGLVEQYNIN